MGEIMSDNMEFITSLWPYTRCLDMHFPWNDCSFSCHMGWDV